MRKYINYNVLGFKTNTINIQRKFDGKKILQNFIPHSIWQLTKENQSNILKAEKYICD